MHSQGLLLNMSAGGRGRWRGCSLHTGASCISQLYFTTVFLNCISQGLQFTYRGKLYVSTVFLNCTSQQYFFTVFLNCIFLLYLSSVFCHCISQPYFTTVFLSCILPLYFSTVFCHSSSCCTSQGLQFAYSGAPAVSGEFSEILSFGRCCTFEWQT